jgi:DNA repair protein RecO
MSSDTKIVIIKALEGIVVDLLDQKDDDLIASILTKDYGLLKVYVKGAKKTKNKSFYIFKVLNIIEFDLSSLNPKGISSYKSGANIKVFNYTNLTLEQSNLVAMIIELLVKINQVYEHDDDYYRLIKETIGLLNQDYQHQTLAILNNVLLKTLGILGVGLHLDTCLACNDEHQQRVVAFDIDQAGFICQKHCQKDHRLITDKKLLEYLFYLNHDNYEMLASYHVYHKVINQLLNKYLIENTGVYLNSLKYIF